MSESEDRTEIAVDPLRNLVGYHLRQASNAAMAALAAAFSENGLTPTSASVLLVIASNPNSRQSAVGRHLSIQRANIAPIIGGLEAGGYLKRTPLDGRSHGLACTKKGAALVERVRKTIEDHEARLFGSFSDGDRQKLIAEFQKIRAEMSKLESFD